MKTIRVFESFHHLTQVVLPLLGLLIALSSCVSVQLGPKKIEKSGDVRFKAPPEPFREIPADNADKAWQSTTSGNSISFLSTCHDPADPELETVARELFSGLTDLKITDSTPSHFNGRKALKTVVEGSVDGIPTRIHSLIFKKNDCVYTLTFIEGLSSTSNEQVHFEGFLKGFEAP